MAEGRKYNTSETSIDLFHDAWGRLVLRKPDGEEVVDVLPLRAFPWSAANAQISVLDRGGREIWHCESLEQLSPEMKQLLESELSAREFVPTIQRIERSSNSSPPTKWRVVTDRGPATITVDSEDSVRRIGPSAVLVIDASGLRFQIPDVQTLDSKSQRSLARLL